MAKRVEMAKMPELVAIMHFFNRFDMAKNEAVQEQIYRWLFDRLSIDRLTMDVDSTVITRNGQQEDAARGYNPNKRGRSSHHPLLAFIAESRMVANFWLRRGNTSSSNNILEFWVSTLHHQRTPDATTAARHGEPVPILGDRARTGDGRDQLPGSRLEAAAAHCGGAPKRQGARASTGQDFEAVCR